MSNNGFYYYSGDIVVADKEVGFRRLHLEQKNYGARFGQAYKITPDGFAPINGHGMHGVYLRFTMEKGSIDPVNASSLLTAEEVERSFS